MNNGAIKKLDDYTFTVSTPVPNDLSMRDIDNVKVFAELHSMAVLAFLLPRNDYMLDTDPAKWQTELQSVEDGTITYTLYYDREDGDDDDDEDGDDSNMLTAYYNNPNPVIAVYTNSTDFRRTISAYKGTLSYYVQGDSFYLLVSPEARAFVLDTSFTYIYADDYAKTKLTYFKEHGIPVNEIQGVI